MLTTSTRLHLQAILKRIAQGKDVSLQERIYWDLEYVKKYNLKLDLKIIFQTIMSVISRKGAS